MMKKWLAVFLILGMVVSLVGCTSDDRITDDLYASTIYVEQIGSATEEVGVGYFDDLYVSNTTLYIGGVPYAPGDTLPDQTGHGGKFLKTDGSVTSWDNPGGGGPHAASHTDGTDDIQDANAGQKGLMTAAYAGKLDAIEANADVTDSGNVNSAGALMNSDADAKGDIFVATADDTVVRLAVGNDGDVLTADSGEASGVIWAVAGGGSITYKAGSITTDVNGDFSVAFNTNMSDTNYAILLTARNTTDTIVAMYHNKAVGGFDIKTQDDSGKDEANAVVDWLVIAFYDP